MTPPTSEYVARSRRLLKQASESLARGDKTDASLKAYEAATHVLELAASRRGWDCSPGYNPHDLVGRLWEETGDAEYFDLFSPAYVLKWEANDPGTSKKLIHGNLDLVVLFVDKMEALLSDDG